MARWMLSSVLTLMFVVMAVSVEAPAPVPFEQGLLYEDAWKPSDQAQIGGGPPQVKSMPVAEPGTYVPSQASSEPIPAPGPWDEPVFSEKYPLQEGQPPQQDKGDKKKQPPQMPQPPNQQDGAPINPADPVIPKEDSCVLLTFLGNRAPTSDPCNKASMCGYPNCQFVWNSGGMSACNDFTKKRQDAIQEPWTIQAGPTTIPNPKKQQKINLADQKGRECCQQRQKAEKAQIKTQQDPCGGAANLAAGGFLTPDQIMQCKANVLNRCKITDKSQLDRLKQDPDFRKSLGNNPNDIATGKEMMKQGGKFGDLSDAMKSQAFAKMAMDMGKSISSLFQGGGSKSSPDSFQTSPGGNTFQADSNTYSMSDLQNGDRLTIDQSAGSVAVKDANGNSMTSMAREASTSPVSVSLPSSGNLRNAVSTPTGVFSVAQSQGESIVQSYGMTVHPESPGSSTTPSVPDKITAAAVVGNVLYYAIVRFFPGEPRMSKLGEIHAGKVASDWIRVIPRANARIDFDAGVGFVTDKVMGMGIPRGSSLMVSSGNLQARSLLNYMIDGVRDYDFILANGLILWPLSGTPGGKIISSSFGVPPEQYLSDQQREMIYG